VRLEGLDQLKKSNYMTHMTVGVGGRKIESSPCAVKVQTELLNAEEQLTTGNKGRLLMCAS
jgi:hypothetical protein